MKWFNYMKVFISYKKIQIEKSVTKFKDEVSEFSS